MKNFLNAMFRTLKLDLVERESGNAAADYPNRSIRFIVPYASGGPGDILARLLAENLSALWKQPVLVENLPGPGGMAGAAEGLKAPADGYTFILAASPHYINPSLYKQVPYDTIRDFQAVTLMISMPNILISNSDLGVGSASELIALAKAKPGHLKYASGGVGTPSHLGAELFKTLTGTDIKHVEYKGHAPAGEALRSGEVSLMFDAILLALPEIKAGKVKALGVTSAKRSSVSPEIPSIAESGLPDFDFSPGVGVLVKAGTPIRIVEKVYEDILKILHRPEIKARLARDGADIVGSAPQEFSSYIEKEIEKWAAVVKAAGITAK